MAFLMIAATRNPEDLKFCEALALRSGAVFTPVLTETQVLEAFRSKQQYLLFWEVDSPDFHLKANPLSSHKILPLLEASKKPQAKIFLKCTRRRSV